MQVWLTSFVAQLNSDFTKHRGFVDVGSNFDNYMTQGTWDFGGGDNYSNAPTSSAGKLRVKTGLYTTQELITNLTTYTRIKYDGVAWSSWISYVKNSDIVAPGSLTSGTLKFGVYNSNGKYYLGITDNNGWVCDIDVSRHK